MNKEKDMTPTPEKYEVLNQQVEQITKQTDKLSIKNDKKLSDALEFYRQLKEAGKALDQDRKDITKDIDSAKKKIMDKYRPRLEFIDEKCKILKEMINKYNQKKKLLEQKKSDHGISVTRKVEGTYTKTTFSVEVIDERIVPEQYTQKVINIKKIEEFAKRTKGKLEIPGIKITQKDQLIIRQV